MVATGVDEDIKASGREATGLGWVLKGVRHPFIWLFLNMATMKGTGITSILFRITPINHLLASTL